FSFTNVVPGTYTIHELAKTGWRQTDPAASGDITVTVNLGDTSVTTTSTGGDIRFGNTPLSDISVNFTPETNPASTQATITCRHAGPNRPRLSHSISGLR